MARVLSAAEKPERLSAGRGVARLTAAGVPVEIGLLAEEAEPLYRAFRHKLETGLPLVEAAGSAEGFDGPLTLESGESLQAALERLGRKGYTRLWVEDGSELASELKTKGYLR